MKKLLQIIIVLHAIAAAIIFCLPLFAQYAPEMNGNIITSTHSAARQRVRVDVRYLLRESNYKEELLEMINQLPDPAILHDMIICVKSIVHEKDEWKGRTRGMYGGDRVIVTGSTDTLIHEIGHAVHDYEASGHQKYVDNSVKVTTTTGKVIDLEQYTSGGRFQRPTLSAEVPAAGLPFYTAFAKLQDEYAKTRQNNYWHHMQNAQEMFAYCYATKYKASNPAHVTEFPEVYAAFEKYLSWIRSLPLGERNSSIKINSVAMPVQDTAPKEEAAVISYAPIEPLLFTPPFVQKPFEIPLSGGRTLHHSVPNCVPIAEANVAAALFGKNSPIALEISRKVDGSYIGQHCNKKELSPGPMGWTFAQLGGGAQYIVSGSSFDDIDAMYGRDQNGEPTKWITGDHAIYVVGLTKDIKGEVVVQLDRYGQPFFMTEQQFNKAGIKGVTSLTKR